MKNTLALFFCIIMLTNTAFAQPEVAAKGAILMDMDSGRVLWSKNGEKPMAMASTTKIMTALIALERGNINDKVVVSKNATLAPKVKMYLQQGEEIRLYDLLLAMMLQSYNDSAVAVAEHIGGSVEDFCAIMNMRAKEIGCKDTVFETPNGIDKGEHHSTARDMALITREALKNEEFCKLIATPEANFTTSKSSYSFINKDRLLREYKGALGVKTGFTNKAGQCFAGAAKRDKKGFVSVVLASGWGTVGKEQKWIDTKEILDYGFESYDYKPVFDENESVAVAQINRGLKDTTALYPRESLEAIVGKEENISYTTYILPNITAPVKKGDTLGTYEAFAGGQSLGKTMLVAHEDIMQKGFSYYIENIFSIFTSFTVGNVV